MALQRLEIREMPLVCEWDEDTGWVMLGLGADREVAWSRFQALHDALIRETGVTWVTEELRERVRTRACAGMPGGEAALVWHAVFTPPGGSRYVSEMILVAAGLGRGELEG